MGLGISIPINENYQPDSWPLKVSYFTNAWKKHKTLLLYQGTTE